MGVQMSREQPNLLDDSQSSSIVYSQVYEHDSYSPTLHHQCMPLMAPPQPAVLLDPRSPSVGIERTPIQLQKSNPQPAMLPDPRSPSVGIERTPIQLQKSNPQPAMLPDPRSQIVGIERTPIQLPKVNPEPVMFLDPRSPSFGIERTPIQLPRGNSESVMVLDPRSPSFGIERTPIHLLELPEVHPEPMMLLDPRSPSVGIERTPIVFCGESECKGSNSSQECAVEAESLIPNHILFDVDAELTLPKADNMLSDIETVSSMQAHIPFDIDTMSPMPSRIDTVSSIPDSIPFNIDTGDDSSSENISISAATVSSEGCDIHSKKVSKIVVKKSLHESSSPSSRSPLAAVNQTKMTPSRSGLNTPRGLVQRKQVLRVEKLRNNVNSPVRQYQVYCDKENNI